MTKFNFWKDNKITNHFVLNKQEIETQFIAWKEHQLKDENRGADWWEYYYGRQLARVFITDPETKKGLQSVFEEKEFENLYQIVRGHLDHKNPTI